MATPQLQPALVIGGNSKAEKFITSMMIVKIRNVLSNIDATMNFRSTATAENISVIGGIGLAIYQIVQRLVWGTDYNINTGAEKQTPAASTTGVNLDQYLTIKWQVEEFDTERFMYSPIKERSSLVNGWAESFTKNLLVNFESIFIRGAIDYCIAKLPTAPVPTVLAIDMTNLTPETADTAFYTIGNQMVDFTQLVDTTIFGTNQGEFDIVFSKKAYLQLTKSYQKIINNVSAETLVTGQLYKDTMLGTTVSTNWFLDQVFLKGTKRAINKDLDFDFRGVFGVCIHRATWAQPISFQSIRQVIDPATGNLQWLGKAMMSLPEALYPLCFIIRKDLPTNEEILAAQSRQWTQGANNLEKTFQLANYDSLGVYLSSVITSGTLTVTGNQTETTLKTALLTAFPTIDNTAYTIIDINNTTKKATAVGDGVKYGGTVALSW